MGRTGEQEVAAELGGVGQRRRAAGVTGEEIDDEEDQIVVSAPVGEHELDRCVRDERPVAEEASPDLARREVGQKAAARHQVLRFDPVPGTGVEDHRLARAEVRGQHADPDVAAIEPIEIDEPRDHRPERLQPVESQHVAAENGGDRVRREQTGPTERPGLGHIEPAEGFRPGPGREHRRRRARGCPTRLLPEPLERIDPVPGSVASDDRAVDRADRAARDPADTIAELLLHRRIGSGLIRAEGDAAGQNHRDGLSHPPLPFVHFASGAGVATAHVYEGFRFVSGPTGASVASPRSIGAGRP